MRIAIILVLVGSASSVAAEPNAAAQAEILFREARELASQGKYAEACAAFASSEQLDPNPATVLNLADCREQNGQLATAWGLFLEAERQTRSATDDATRQLHVAATTHATSLEPRISKLTISISPEHRLAGLTIGRGDEIIDPGRWNRALPMDGGSYTITARAPGREAWTTTITVDREADSKTVDIPALAELPPNAPAVTAVEQPVVRSRLPFVLGVGAIAVLGGGLAFELVAERNYNRSAVETDDAKQRSLYHSATVERYTAEALTVAGVACAGIAIYRFIVDRRAPSTRVKLEPIVTANAIGWQVRASW